MVLSKRPSSWKEFFDLTDKLRAEAPEEFEDFLVDRGDHPPQKRNLF